MPDRVFSYKNWEIFWGFNPSHTKRYKNKLKKVDGSPVKYAGYKDAFTGDDIYYFSHNPFGDSCFTIPGIITREPNGKDYEIDEVIADDELSLRVVWEMNKDRVWMPAKFKTLAYIDDFDNNAGGFAITSVSQRNIGDTADFYKLHSQIWPINQTQRMNMLENFLKPHNRFVANGVLECNNDVCVFVMPINMVVDSMMFANDSFHYSFNALSLDKIHRYLDTYDNARTFNNELYSHYNGVCLDILDHFSNCLPNETPYNLVLKSQNENIPTSSLINASIAASIKVNELQEENKKLREKDLSEIMHQITSNFKETYEYLEPDALEKLITGEAQFQISSKSDNLNFDAAISGYASAVEIQLFKHLSSAKPDLVYETMNLGSIIKLIEEYSIAPYHKSIHAYTRIKDIRNDTLHRKSSNKAKAEELRKLLFEDGVLDKLK